MNNKLEGLPEALICDLDGTLALFGTENPYDRDFTKDKVNTPVFNILKWAVENEIKILLVSGRKDKFKQQTLEWLLNKGIYYDAIFMRKTEDNRKDVIVKKEIYNDFIKDKYHILFVLDDRNQVVEFWRSINLTCLQVANGDF